MIAAGLKHDVAEEKGMHRRMQLQRRMRGIIQKVDRPHQPRRPPYILHRHAGLVEKVESRCL
jgi:hypothetical protein